MKYIKTSKGNFPYEQKFIYLGIKRINKSISFDNLKDILTVMKSHNIRVSPACGSLLGIIRDGDFIDWDEDIDLNILQEDIERFKNSLWDLKEKGFELSRCDRCGHLYSVTRNGEFVDFYIMEKISPEIRTNMGPDFVFDKHLVNLMDWDFNGLKIQVPVEYESYLELMYGDWRTPVQYADFEISKFRILVKYIWASIKNLPPYPIRIKLLKHHHRKDLRKFLNRCEKYHVELKYQIDY